MCAVLNVSRSSYYSWISRKPSVRSQENQKLTQEIKKIYLESRRTYGSPRITAELKKRNFNASRPRVARLMKKEKIHSIIKKKHVVTTDSNHSYAPAPNLLQRNFNTSAPGCVWVSDITYINTRQGWLYLTIVLDLYDRKIIGWALSNTMHTMDTTIPALKMALKNRTYRHSLIFHSDRGIQYASKSFRKTLLKNKIKQSMSRKGDCWDNAVAESFFKTIKTECSYQNKFENKDIAARTIFEYIEIWYNRKRRHSALKYATPEEMEILYYKLLAA